jgi:NAD(P)-dependent dehydrogenase (short-subunit alcohol dehydrogenase family)
MFSNRTIAAPSTIRPCDRLPRWDNHSPYMADDMSTTDNRPPDLQWRLDGRVALVTGASSGLGARFARVLHQAGANVLVTARRGDRLGELASECGERIETMTGDITDARHREALAERLQSHGRLDVLVNNAGICDDGPIEGQSLDDLRQVIEVNLISVMDMCRLMAPLLLASPVASVINIASIYGVVSSRGPMAGYNATKGAVVNLTRQLAAQWGGRGVRVNALAPGYFPSEMTGFLADEDFARSIRGRTLLARTPALHEIDGPLLFLASDASSYMTGHVLLVDGGWTAV